jgi:predicted Holliday junction resolvase-like endonuclease
MKFLNVLLIVFTIVLISSCGTSKEVAQQKNPQEENLEQAYKQKEYEYKMAELEAEHKRKMAELEKKSQIVYQPCKEDAFDGTDYMASLGTANGQANEHIASSSALKSAKAMIMNRYMGAFKVGLKEYSNSTTGASKNSRDLAKLEGGVMSAGEKAIDKYVSVVCQEVLKNDLGGYDAYVAIHVSTKEVKQEIASKLEAMEVDYNAEKLFNYIDKEVEARKEHKEAANQY